MAMVTGASRGIGRAVAKKLASAGYDLIVTCVHQTEQLETLAQELKEAYGINCVTFTGDLSDPAVCADLFGRVNTLDVLVNNAGISKVGLLTDLSVEDWKEIVGINLSAPVYLSKLAIPLFLQKKAGCIVNISSVWGEAGASTEVAYSATKGGLNAFTKALAKELAPSGIRVNAIACGLIDTQMNAHLGEDEMRDLIAQIPADRAGTPEDVADLVLQLTQSGTYMTGQVIGLDGGWM